MGQVHFSGLQLLWPKYANTFSCWPVTQGVCESHFALLIDRGPRVCVRVCPNSHACVLVFLLCVYMPSCVRLSVLMHDQETRVRA